MVDVAHPAPALGVGSSEANDTHTSDSKQNRPVRRAPQQSRALSNLIRGLWLRSILGLLLIALLATATYYIINSILELNENTGKIVNVSGRQRMLSQRTAFYAQKMITAKTDAEALEARGKLEQAADLMLVSHQALVNGSEEMDIPAAESAALKEIYFGKGSELDKQVLEYVDAIKQLVGDQDLWLAREDSEKFLFILDTAPDRLLTTLNQAVLQYEKEAKAAVQRAISYESMLYAITLLTLLLIALFIYRPLVNRVKRVTQNLMRQQQFSEQVINTSQALIVGVNQQGETQLYNQYSQDLSGWSDADVAGKNFVEELIPEAEHAAFERSFSDLFTEEGGERIETSLTKKDGEALNIEWSNSLLRDPVSNKPLMILTTGLDITDRKKAALELSAALEETALLSERLQEEVSHAAILQRALLPEPVFELAGISGIAELTTSTEVGGDYYDYYLVNDRYAVFLVGDVSGHGVASGTLVSAAKMSVHQLQSMGETDPAKMLEHINASLLTASHESMFMTMICFCVDSSTGRAWVANAGHVFPYIWIGSEKAWCMIETEGVPLGKIATPEYQAIEFEISPGDKFFIYTDGIIEEESPAGEQFGFERTEEMLYNIADLSLSDAHKAVFKSLASHCERDDYSDDVTVMLVEHTARTEAVAAELPAKPASESVITLNGDDLRDRRMVIDEHFSRQHVVVNCEQEQVRELLPSLCQQGVRRLLPSDQLFLHTLGWEELISQHLKPAVDDIEQWIRDPVFNKEWSILHSSDKQVVIQKIASSFSDMDGVSESRKDIAVLMVDELLENSLYGAPRDRSNNQLFQKGAERVVASYEGIRIRLLQDKNIIGLMVTDNWGTFTPATFLNRLRLNLAEEGMVAGVGGTGMYLMWQMCDYMQIRVLPHQSTQVTLLWSLEEKEQDEYAPESGFQFLYHSELNEIISEG